MGGLQIPSPPDPSSHRLPLLAILPTSSRRRPLLLCDSSVPHALTDAGESSALLTQTTTAWTPARIRLVSRSAPSHRNPLRFSPYSQPTPDVAGDEGKTSPARGTGRWRRTGTSGTGSRWRCGSCRGRRTAGWCARGCGSARRSRPSGPRSPTTRASPASSPASPSAASSTRTKPSPASTRSGSRIWRWGSSSTPRAPSTPTRARWSCSQSLGRAAGRSPSTWSTAISRSSRANGLSRRVIRMKEKSQSGAWLKVSDGICLAYAEILVKEWL
ncbi:hypothetical protein ACQJBY_046236 [Aegilops geniculata]